MNREDMADKQLDLALKYAALVQAITDPENQPSQYGTVTLEYLNKAIAAEREACAKLCESIDDSCPDCAAHNDHDQCVVPQANDYAAAIRARSQS